MSEARFGDVLKRARKHMKLTQEKLANLVNIDAATISRIESNLIRPSRKLQDSLVNKLGMDKTNAYHCYPSPLEERFIEYEKTIDEYILSKNFNAVRLNIEEMEKDPELMKYPINIQYVLFAKASLLINRKSKDKERDI